MRGKIIVKDNSRIIFLICTTSGWYVSSATAQTEWKLLSEIKDWVFPPLLFTLERAVMDKFQITEEMELQCHSAHYKNGFMSQPLSSEPKVQSWAGIGLSLKCSLLPEATRWRKSQEELLGTFSSEVAPGGSAAFSPHKLHFLTEALSVKNRLKIKPNASRLHNEMLATRCCSHVTHSPAFLFSASFCSG